MNILTEWLNQNFVEEDPIDFYRAVFPAGELDQKDAFTPGRYTGIIVCVTGSKKKDGRPKVKRYTITDDLDAVRQVMETDYFCLCSPISYAGMKRTAEAARMLYGIAVDMDKVIIRDGQPRGLIDLWNGHIQRADRIPKPTYIVSSGSGLHLYYLLERPVKMFPKVAKKLQKLKHELTELIWNEGLVDIQDDRDIQQEGIYQGFRMPGTITKDGGRARVFLTGKKVTIEYLNKYVHAENRVTDVWYKSTITLEDAKEKYPDWYEWRIERKQDRRYWNISRNLYDWWKAEIQNKARVGHRYFCLMCLASIARKCSRYDPKHNPNPVTYEELEKDSFDIMERFEELTDDERNHFTAADVLSALEAFEDRWNTYPREAIEYRSGIMIPANKRNGRKQNIHLQRARAVQEIDYPMGEWRTGNGRKSKQPIVEEWQRRNPGGRKADCRRDTGLSRPTIDKYWK